jgi:signal transduction histidine kinase
MDEPIQSQLIRAVQQLAFCRDEAGIMRVLRDAARGLIGCDGITVVLRDGEFCHYVEEDAVAPLWKGRRFPLTSCVSGWCMLNKQRVAIPDVYADPRVPVEAYRPTFVKSLAMVPIRGEEPIGAIGAYWAQHHEPSESELGTIQALADSAAMAVLNISTTRALEEANRRKDQFLSMLAHELRNPIAPIRNALYLLRARGLEPETLHWAREVMERQTTLLTRMVDELLDASRLMHGKITLHPTRLDLAALVRQNVEDSRGVLESAGLRVQVETPDQPVWIKGDAVRLAQVLGNLLDNARKFTPGGEVVVRLEQHAASSHAVLTVRDSGMGIERDLLPSVFEAFAQADRSLDRKSGGLGLGLSVAQGLIRLHGGSIDVASEGAGQGTEVTIRLALEPEPHALTFRGPYDAALGRRRRVLIIEDNRDSAESLRRLLQLSGNEVLIAHSGPDGLELARTRRPELILCDIGLPGMDGFALAHALRKLPETASARLVAITGYGREEDRKRALQAGFDLHLIKPVEPETLLGQLTSLA